MRYPAYFDFIRLLSVVAGAVFLTQVPALAQERQRNVTSDRYVVNQTFDGQAFSKDSNVWVYTPAFAETFGMPPEAIYAELKGIEAAAFRTEDKSYQMCGMGGKAENCMNKYRCVTDVYIDETKHPLPWATDQLADWLPDYNSTRWLRTSKERAVNPRAPAGVTPNRVVNMGTFTLRPFADPQTRKEANFFENSQSGKDDSNLAIVLGYKRQAIAGLTMISFSYRCNTRNRSEITFLLEVRNEIFSPTLKQFHEFRLPDTFERRIDAQLEASHARDREYYKTLLNLK